MSSNRQAESATGRADQCRTVAKSHDDQAGYPRTLTRMQVAAYALPGIPTASLGLPLVIYLPPFYAQDLGLSLAVVGIIFGISKVWDLLTDPVLGLLSDRFPSRFGRRRHWFVASVPILVVSVWHVFLPTAEVGAGYLLGWLLILYVGWTLLTLSHTSWGAELTPHYHERSTVQGWREFAITIGMFAILALSALIGSVRPEDEASRVASMGWFFLVTLPPTATLAVWLVPERAKVHPDQVGVSRALRILIENRLMLRVLGGDLMGGVASGTVASLYVFFTSHGLGLREDASGLLLLYFLGAALGVPIWIRLSYRHGKHRVVAAAAFYTCSLLPLALLVGPDDLGIYAVFNVFLGVGYGAGPFLFRAITADITDYDRNESGGQRTGLYFAMLTITNKAGSALAIGLTYPLLHWVGFNPNGENSAVAIDTLRYTFVALPTLLLLLMGWLMWHFPFNEKAQMALRVRLEAEDGATR